SNTEPRIALNAGGRGSRGGRGAGETGVSITAYMMSPGEDKIVGDRIHAILSIPRQAKSAAPPKPAAGDVSGPWDVHIDFAAGSSEHALHLTQRGNDLVGTHQGDFLARDLSGAIDGDEVHLASSVAESHGDALSYRFSGKLSGDMMSGALDMGEYLN